MLLHLQKIYIIHTFLYILYIFIMNQNNLHQFSMYFHTTIRNIGLYTSLSYATLAYSRVYRNNNPFYDIMLILISLIFLAIAFIINYFLYNVSFSKINRGMKLSSCYAFHKPSSGFILSLFYLD
jgi:hypothetical protein